MRAQVRRVSWGKRQREAEPQGARFHRQIERQRETQRVGKAEQQFHEALGHQERGGATRNCQCQALGQ